MKNIYSRLLVIDASVARSAGETEHPVSSACRECLQAVLTICHRVVITEPIKSEWDRHMSRFTRKWRLSMAARRKWNRDLEPAEITLNIGAFPKKAQEEIEKDRHLLEAAVAADRVILTLDDSLRSALNQTQEGSKFFKSIKWLNPVHDGIEMLKSL
jgi:hypothetical protein